MNMNISHYTIYFSPHIHVEISLITIYYYTFFSLNS